MNDYQKLKYTYTGNYRPNEPDRTWLSIALLVVFALVKYLGGAWILWMVYNWVAPHFNLPIATYLPFLAVVTVIKIFFGGLFNRG